MNVKAEDKTDMFIDALDKELDRIQTIKTDFIKVRS